MGKLTKREWFLLAFCLITLLLLIGVCNQKSNSDHKEKPYTSDTLDVKEPYKPDTTRDKKSKEVKPKIVYRYRDTGSTQYRDTGSYRVVYRDATTGEVGISLDGDKPIVLCDQRGMRVELLKIGQDSLKVDIYKPGVILSKSYPLFLDKYRYELQDDQLRAIPINGYNLKGNRLFPKVTFGSNAYFLYSPIGTSGYKGAIDYYMTLGKFSIYGVSSLSTNEKPRFNTYLGIRYQLK